MKYLCNKDLYCTDGSHSFTKGKIYNTAPKSIVPKVLIEKVRRTCLIDNQNDPHFITNSKDNWMQFFAPITIKVGDIVYNKSRHGFMQIKEIKDNNIVTVSGPCTYFDDAKTNIRRTELSIHTVNRMEICTKQTLPNQSFAELYNIFGTKSVWRSKEKHPKYY